jgi:hypothetical protein
MIGIARRVARVSVLDFAGSVGEAVPDGFAFAIFLPRAFDLVGGSGRAPEKILRKRLQCLRRESIAQIHGGLDAK